MSEDLRRSLRMFDVRTAFITVSTLRQQLTRVKDVDPPLSKAGVVYRLPCSCTCGKEYIGKTKKALGAHIKEHQSATRREVTGKSVVGEYAWAEQHHPIWDQTSVIEEAKSVDLLQIKEEFCITTAESHFYSKERALPHTIIHSVGVVTSKK